MKSPIALLRSLLIDFKRLEPGVKGLERDLLTLELRAEHEGFSFFTVALPAYCDSLDRGLAEGQFTCPKGFKKAPKEALPKLFSGLLCEVFHSKTGHLVEAPNLGAVKCLREVLRLYKKTLVDDIREKELDLSAQREFVETDVNASYLFFEDRHSHLLDRVCSFVLGGLNSRDLREIDCKHGPGGVYEGVKGNQKWTQLLNSILGEEFDTDSYGYSDFGNSVYYSGNLPGSISPSRDPVGVVPRTHASSSVSRLVTVPKNSTSRRTITVEPMLKQFIQQGLNTILRDEISRCSVLRHCLDLSDQSKNQKLALIGSRTCEWSTIDLKAASDSLSVMLVEKVFARHRGFLSAMLDCRSPSAEIPNKGRLMLRKFAGMGNALTFPVQSIVFALIAITAILDQGGVYPTMGRLRRAARLVRVFGDDIVVHSDYAHHVVVWLQRAGLKINTKKSFLEGNFKESCGVDAFRGVDVTPLYIKYRPGVTAPTPSMIANWVSVANHAWLRGLYLFSATLVTSIEEALKKPLPLVRSDSGVLGLHTRREWSTIERWNRTLHRPEYRAICLVPKKHGDKLNGYAALLKFFHRKMEDLNASGPITIDPLHLEKSPVRFQVKLAKRWVPA